MKAVPLLFLLLVGFVSAGTIPEQMHGMWELDEDATAMALRDAGQEAETAHILQRVKHYAYGFTESEMIGVLEERRYTLPVHSVTEESGLIRITFGDGQEQVMEARLSGKGILSLRSPQSNDLDALRWKRRDTQP